uniref:Glutathione S-transferase n=1 Tax=Hordeum vulgare subsp. vulgare TaxID=112509 RepID=F2DT58_HORVV|nr:predicted protein [Hordeum vulgare subsp. vulgare]
MANNMVHDESEVVCIDFWANLFGMRVLIALRELGVSFKYIEEDLRVCERSDLVLRMNPVHRMVPILIHHGRPICNSINILEYIDEVWGHRQETQAGGTRLLPIDPLHRAYARFWADFVDNKVCRTTTLFGFFHACFIISYQYLFDHLYHFFFPAKYVSFTQWLVYSSFALMNYFT